MSESKSAIKWEFDPTMPTGDFFEGLDPDDTRGLQQAVESFVYDVEEKAFLTWEAVVCHEQSVPLTPQQEELLDALLNFGDPDDDQVFYINGIPRTTEPWYEILRKIAPHLLVEPFVTSEVPDEVKCEGWERLADSLRRDGQDLSLPEGVASPVEVVPDDVRHKLWLQWCFDELLGLGQSPDITLEEQPWRIDLFIRRLHERKDSVAYFNLTLDTLLARVILPDRDRSLFVKKMQEKLGLASGSEPLADALERLPEPKGDVDRDEWEPKFTVGDRVRVTWGTADPDYPDLPMGGWAGTIVGVHEDERYSVRWSQETLHNVHPVYKKRCERDGLSSEESWARERDLGSDPGGPVSIEQPTEIATRPLSVDDENDRVRMALGLTTDDVVPLVARKWLRRYRQYLAENLSFPFQAEYLEEDDRLTVIGMSEGPLDEREGIMLRVSDGKNDSEAPLRNLGAVRGERNCQLIDDCVYWHWEFGGFLSAREDDDYYEDDPEPPPTTVVSEEKVGRNAPCPCGSGKKFKKCFLKKRKSSSLFD